MQAKNGSNIVNASNNSGGLIKNALGAWGKFQGLKLGMALQSAQQEKVTEEVNKRATHKTNEDLRKQATLGIMSPYIAGHSYDYALQTYGEDHPDVVSGKRQANEYIRPEMAAHVASGGFVSGKNGIMPAPVAKGRQQEEARIARFRETGGNPVPTRTPSNVTNVGEGNLPSGAAAARFSTDKETGNVTIGQKDLTFADVQAGRGAGRRAPMSLREDDSIAPSDRTWTPEQKAALESERPSRNENLNLGTQEGK